jgi:chromosome segregation ATPase
MNKAKLSLYSVLATVGLKETAQDVLVAEFKKHLPSLADLETASEKLRTVKATYETLKDNLTSEIESLQAEIAELEQSVYGVDVTKAKAVDEIMKINAEIAVKKDRISAVQSALMTLEAKEKAEIMDTLAEGFIATKKVFNEANMLVENVKPVVNAMNKTAIVNGLTEIDDEITSIVKEFNRIAFNLGVSKQQHKGVLLYTAHDSAYMGIKINQQS